MEKYSKPKDLGEKLKNWTQPEFSDGATQILGKRCLLKDDQGNLDETPKEMLYRVAHVLASADKKYKDFDSNETEKTFYNMMAEQKFFPNSPTLRGAGLNINLSACYKIPIEDSREGIFRDGLYWAIDVQAYGGGTGFNFSNLRPKGALISTTKGKSSGVISFMKIFDQVIGPVIAQGGVRNGANMGILEYWHPDILEFIDCKKNKEVGRNFNISVGLTKKFMSMVKKNETYELSHIKSDKKIKVNAKDIFHKIIENAWSRGDPGIIFVDKLEGGNPTPAIGKIDGTNPCGEQPLLDLEACNLGSINLKRFVENKKINYDSLRKTVYAAVHMLDNVIDINNYPLVKPEKEQKELENLLEKNLVKKGTKEKILAEFRQSPIDKIVKSNRKIGLGVMGWANLLTKLDLSYGSEESLKLAEEVMEFIDQESKNASVKLAKTRGVFPNWEGSIYDSKSPYFKGKEMKLRHATTTTIAPTGTLSTLAGVEGGIEPIYGITFTKNAIYNTNGKAEVSFTEPQKYFLEIAKKEEFYSDSLMLEIGRNKGSIQKMPAPKNVSSERWSEIQKIFITTHDLEVEKHVGMQVAFQKHIDNAVSKTINMPQEAPIEWVEKAFWLAYESGLKGITIYKDKSLENQVRTTGEEKKSLDIKNGDRPEVIGTTIKQSTPYGPGFITLNVLKEDTSIPFESFINIGKGGKDMSAIAEGYGRLVSLCFKYGTPAKEVVNQLRGIGGETQTGFGKNKVQSLPDALGQGIEEGYTRLNNGKKIDKPRKNNSGNLCPDCGALLILSEGCEKCRECGFAKC